MSKGLRLARFIGAVGLLAVAPLAFGAEERPCSLRDATSPAPNTVLALCEEGSVYVTTDAGATWTARETGAKVVLRSIAFSDATHGFITGNAGTLLVTSDGGKTWQPAKSGTTENLLAAFHGSGVNWAAGAYGVILRSTDAGKTWTQVKSGTTQGIESIFFRDAKLGWLVGWAGTIMRTTDGGDTWKDVKSDAASWSLASVYFRDEKNGWIAGFAGALVRSRDGGATWQPLTSNTKAWLTAINVDRAGRMWVAADDQFLMSEDGDKWKAITIEEQLFLRKIIRVGDALWAVGQLGIMRQDASGMKWLEVKMPIGSIATPGATGATTANGTN